MAETLVLEVEGAGSIPVTTATLIRDPQPNDVLVLRVGRSVTYHEAELLRVAATQSLGCKVIVLAGEVEVARFETVRG